MSELDPAKRREERRARARQDAKSITEERRREIRQTINRPIVSSGQMDAVSLPIEAESGPAPFMEGDGSDWLFPVGSGKNRDSSEGSLPRQLAEGGWIYLRADQRLVARARYLGTEHRQVRIEHITSPGGFEDAGPGYVLKVDPTSWQEVDIPVTDAEMGNGYRYYQIDSDGQLTFTRVTS